MNAIAPTSKVFVTTSRWNDELYLYRDELQMMANRLEELSVENGCDEFQPAWEYYLDQLTNLSIALDRFTQSVRQHEKEMNDTILRSPGTKVEAAKQQHYTLESGSMDRIRQEVKSLHLDFECFCYSWM